MSIGRDLLNYTHDLQKPLIQYPGECYWDLTPFQLGKTRKSILIFRYAKKESDNEWYINGSDSTYWFESSLKFNRLVLENFKERKIKTVNQLDAFFNLYRLTML